MEETTYYVIPFIKHSEKDNAIGNKNRLGMTKPWDEDIGRLQRGLREPSRVMEIFHTLMW